MTPQCPFTIQCVKLMWRLMNLNVLQLRFYSNTTYVYTYMCCLLQSFHAVYPSHYTMQSLVITVFKWWEGVPCECTCCKCVRLHHSTAVSPWVLGVCSVELGLEIMKWLYCYVPQGYIESAMRIIALVLNALTHSRTGAYSEHIRYAH